jgi:hypothetical protein
MVKRFDEQWRAKEKGSSDHSEVARAVADLLADDDARSVLGSAARCLELLTST